MSVKTTLTLTRNFAGALSFVSGHSIRDDIQRLLNFISGALGGAGDGASAISISENAVAGSATLALTGVVANQVILINGVPFTAVSGAATAGNDEFDISGSDSADAAALAAAINASTTAGVAGVVTAAALSNEVTLSSVAAGAGANAITVENLGVVAFGTATCAGVDVADAIAINGEAITATQSHATETLTLTNCAVGAYATINGTRLVAVASGANGTFTFSQAGSDTADAAALAAAINANPDLTGIVTATSALGVVTVRAVNAGTAGNSISIGANGSGITFFGLEDSAGMLSGGASQGDNEFDPTGSNAVTAAALAAAINASPSDIINKHVRALARSAVVYIFAKYGGPAGNAITLTTTDGTDLAVSGARLTGGTLAQYEGAQATLSATVTGADGGTYRTTINGVDVDATGTNGDDTATAVSIASAINASTSALVSGVVRASSALGTVTLVAVRGGHQGNAITVAVTGTGYAVDVITSGHMEGGAAPTSAVVEGGSASILGNGARTGGGSNDAAVTYSFGMVTP